MAGYDWSNGKSNNAVYSEQKQKQRGGRDR